MGFIYASERGTPLKKTEQKNVITVQRFKEINRTGRTEPVRLVKASGVPQGKAQTNGLIGG